MFIQLLVKQEKSCIHVLWSFSYTLTSSQIGSQQMIAGLTLCSQTSLGMIGDMGEYKPHMFLEEARLYKIKQHCTHSVVSNSLQPCGL